MPTTNIEGPHNNQAIGTGIGDGISYTGFGQPQRIHENSTGASAAFGTAANRGTLWYNCFNASQIPAGATITGMEIVAGTDFDGSGNSNIGNFGSTGATESATFQMYLFNGTDYSSPLTFLSTPSGGSLNGDSTELTLTGGNKRYLGISTLGVLAGSSTGLSGLSWNVSDQATWGFAFTCIAINLTPVYGALRGIGLRATYTTAGFSKHILSIAEGNVDKILASDISTISKVIGTN
tara:strand:+ start:183 stop:890 length:708 start_codon:yes stop_codon:yes gene_type:complete